MALRQLRRTAATENPYGSPVVGDWRGCVWLRLATDRSRIGSRENVAKPFPARSVHHRSHDYSRVWSRRSRSRLRLSYPEDCHWIGSEHLCWSSIWITDRI